MTVQRGVTWGEPAASPTDAVEVRSDQALAAALHGGGRRPIIVRGGDLHRSLGSPAGVSATMRMPVDTIAVIADGRHLTAVAHVIARRRGPLGWWRDRIVAVMNVDHLGGRDVAPRAHPNDGWLDVVEVSESMSPRARWQAWRRLPTGSHLPHPDVTTRRIRSQSWDLGRGFGLWVDGVARGTVGTLRVEVDPDAAEIFV